MGDMFKTLNNATGGLFGETDSQFQAKQATQNANKAQAQGQQYANQAAPGLQYLTNAGISDRQNTGGYAPLAGYGQNLMNTAQNGLSGALDQYRNLTGLNGSDPNNPYALNDVEKTQLNQGLDTINARHQSAQSQYAAEMARRGITDPADLAAGQAALTQSFGQLADKHSNDFMTQNQAQKAGAAQNYTNLLASLGQAGTSAYGQGVQGSNSEIQGGAQGLEGLAGQQNGVAANQNQLALQNQANNQGALASLLQLAGYGLGGGFGGAAAKVAGAANQGATAGDLAGIPDSEMFTLPWNAGSTGIDTSILPAPINWQIGGN
jgi:hypothetical protein